MVNNFNIKLSFIQPDDVISLGIWVLAELWKKPSTTQNHCEIGSEGGSVPSSFKVILEKEEPSSGLKLEDRMSSDTCELPWPGDGPMPLQPFKPQSSGSNAFPQYEVTEQLYSSRLWMWLCSPVICWCNFNRNNSAKELSLLQMTFFRGTRKEQLKVIFCCKSPSPGCFLTVKSLSGCWLELEL